MISKKICLLGSFSVGKTSLVSRYVKSLFSEEYHTTLGVKVDKKEVEVQGTTVKLMIWDIAGKDEFFDPPISFLKGSSGYLLVVDGTRAATLQVAETLHQTMLQTVGKVPFIVLVNKSDLADEWEIRDEQIEALRQTGARVVLSSAKTGENVEAVFTQLATEMTVS